MFRFLGHTDGVLDLTFSPSGHLVASASRDRSVRLWVPSAVRGTSGEFRAHTGSVRSVHFSPDGHQLVTSSDDKSIKLWSVARRRFVLTLHGHSNWVRCSRFSPDGNAVASCADDKSIKLFDPRSGQCTYTFHETKGKLINIITILICLYDNIILPKSWPLKLLVGLYIATNPNFPLMRCHPQNCTYLTLG